jgi:hypothetical protein
MTINARRNDLSDKSRAIGGVQGEIRKACIAAIDARRLDGDQSGNRGLPGVACSRRRTSQPTPRRSKAPSPSIPKFVNASDAQCPELRNGAPDALSNHLHVQLTAG